MGKATLGIVSKGGKWQNGPKISQFPHYEWSISHNFLREILDMEKKLLILKICQIFLQVCKSVKSTFTMKYQHKAYVNKIFSPSNKTSCAIIALTKIFMNIWDLMQHYNIIRKILAILALIINADAQNNHEAIKQALT